MNLGASSMNGSGQPQVQVLGPDTTIATMQPIAITPGTIKMFMGAIAGIIAFLAATPVAERYLNPAKQSDLIAIEAIVKTLQEGQTIMKAAQAEQRMAVERLTMAVDNLSGIVAELRQAGTSVKSLVPRGRVR